MPKFRSFFLMTIATLLGIAISTPSASARPIDRVESLRSASYAAIKVWGACGRHSAEDKIIRTFDRVDADDGHRHFLPGGRSNLLCGSAPKFGYRHIVAGHQGDWENAAFMTGENWREVADFAIATVLTDPDMVTYRRQNATFCFSKVIYLYNKRSRRVVRTKTPKVVIGARNKRIVTAIPTNSQCRDELAGT